MRLALIACAALLALPGCSKDAPTGAGPAPAPITSSTTDALWAFAPPGVEVAVVVADGALAALHGGALRALADVARAPGGAAIAARARKEASALPIDLLDPAAVSGAGLDLARGAAIFHGPGGRVLVVPVGDARKLVTRLGGRSEGGVDRIGPMACRAVSGRYVCADDLAGLGAVSGKGGAGPLASWPAAMRGHMEVFVSATRLGDLPLQDPRGLRVAAVFERGAMTVRAHLAGSPTGQLAAIQGARSHLVEGLAEQEPTGLFVINAQKAWKMFQALDLAGPTDAPGGVKIADLTASVTGAMVAHALPGQPPRGMMRIELSNDGPMKKVVGACTELAAAGLRGVTFAQKRNHCVVTVEPDAAPTALPGLGRTTLDVWVEPQALVVGVGDLAAAAVAGPGLAPFAREILEGTWLFAAWGRGAVTGGPVIDRMQAADPTGGFFLWATRHLNELGMAMTISDDGFHAALRIRTLWANPDDVIAAVQATMASPPPPDLPARLKKVVADHPASPFAGDVAADQAGLTVQVAAIGAMAGVAIPAFMQYVKRSKTTEARASLTLLHLGAGGTSTGVGAPFAAPSAGPTPPLGECCRQGGQCAPDPALWTAAPWPSLHFAIDRPHYYSYEYRVSGDSFTVLAHGDLDCDGVYSTFSKRGWYGPGGLVGSEVEVERELE